MDTQSWEHSIVCKIIIEEFWTAVEVWIKKPHVVNGRIWGTALLHSFNVSPQISCNIYDNLGLRAQSKEAIIHKENCLHFLTNHLNVSLAETGASIKAEINIIKQLPKSAKDPPVYQLVVKDFLSNSVYFVEIFTEKSHCLGPRFPYSFHHKEDSVVLKGRSDPEEQSVKWLKEIAFPYVVKWATQTSMHMRQHGICPGSLTLVNNEAYHAKYNELKLKYGKEMVRIWPECTDPSKFVYEDVAIASYLLLLWESERKSLQSKELQSFVDLGCGNGLLVYILASEGHHGAGIDVRKRNIWNMYPQHVVLKEQTVSPSDMYLFPDTDWVIGNHSDELTPWIPVIASRSSYTTNFFLLPCCAYNFNGTKYQRKNSSKSQYNEYLEYVHQLCQDCGYETKVDRLKIPSTKRICFVGSSRTYEKSAFNKKCSEIQTLILEDQKGIDWISDFKPREATELVKNCTRIDRAVIDSIVELVGEHLMKGCVKGGLWSSGKSADISQLVHLIPENLLKALKSECGGLQTLLRNHNHIFRVEMGKVELRKPQTVHELSAVKKNRKKSKTIVSIKKKSCWFYNKHPQGCPLRDEDCRFIHEKL